MCVCFINLLCSILLPEGQTAFPQNVVYRQGNIFLVIFYILCSHFPVTFGMFLHGKANYVLGSNFTKE